MSVPTPEVPSKTLKAELDWIDANIEKYDSPMHAEAVKRNIEKRYVIADLWHMMRAITQEHGIKVVLPKPVCL